MRKSGSTYISLIKHLIHLRPSFLRLDFHSHSQAWKAYELLQEHRGTTYAVDWIKTTQFYNASKKLRDRSNSRPVVTKSGKVNKLTLTNSAEA